MPVTKSKTRVIKTRTAQAWMEDDHLLRVKVLKGSVIMLEDAQRDIQIGEEMTADKEFVHMLVDLRGVSAISRDARQYYSKPRGNGRKNTNKAIAILTGSPLSKVIANFFIGINKPKMPIKLFTRELEAKNWLESLGNTP